MTKQTRRESIIGAYKEVFNSAAGEKVLEDLMRTFHVNSPMVTSNPDSLQFLPYSEGQRSVVMRILKTIKTDVAKMKKRIDEQNEQQENYDDFN